MCVLVWCVVCTGLACYKHVLDWCVVCTGLMCCMYWTGMLHVLGWCVGLVYRKIWTSVFYILDWCVHKNISVLYVLLYALDGYVVHVGAMYAGLQCGTAQATVIQKPTLNDIKCSDYGWVCLN